MGTLAVRTIDEESGHTTLVLLTPTGSPEHRSREPPESRTTRTSRKNEGHLDPRLDWSPRGSRSRENQVRTPGQFPETPRTRRQRERGDSGAGRPSNAKHYIKSWTQNRVTPVEGERSEAGNQICRECPRVSRSFTEDDTGVSVPGRYQL